LAVLGKFKNNFKKKFTIRNILIALTVWITGSILKEFNVFSDFDKLESILYYLFMPSLGLILYQKFSIRKVISMFINTLCFKVLIIYISNKYGVD